MKQVLVLGGTRFFGIHLVKSLLEQGAGVTLATRGLTPDPFGSRVNRIRVDRTDPDAMKAALQGARYDVVFDDVAYCSNDVKNLLDSVSAERLVQVSSASVYPDRPDTPEEEFDPFQKELVWCDRTDFDYGEGKRQAECALFQADPGQNAVAVRFPYVIGPDDYTRRLLFYVEHIRKGLPMQVDNLDARLSFISSEEAGRFLCHLGSRRETGPFNAAAQGTVSLRKIFRFVEEHTGKSVLLSPGGEEGPYNGCESFSLRTDRAEAAGISFSKLEDWLPGLLERYLQSTL